MALGKFVAEAVGEGLFLKALGEIWKMAVGIFTKEVGAKATEKIKEAITSIDPRGHGDEHYFALDLVEANITSAQRDIINDGVMLAEEFDRINGTRSARNFRIIVTLQDKECTDPLNRPGKLILEKIANSCADANAVFIAIKVMGSMHEPGFSLEKMMHDAKSTVLPFLKKKAQGIKIAAAAVSLGLDDYATNSEKEYEKRLWFKKIPGIGGFFR